MTVERLRWYVQEYDGRLPTFLSCKGWVTDRLPDEDRLTPWKEFVAYSMDGNTWDVSFSPEEIDLPANKREWLDYLAVHLIPTLKALNDI